MLAEVYARVSAIPMLAHYTSVEAMGNILRSKQFWFSSISSMAAVDETEMREGAEWVYAALMKFGPQIIKTIPFPAAAVTQFFNQLKSTLITETYAISLSEHGSNAETDRLNRPLGSKPANCGAADGERLEPPVRAIG
jgi:hypothetical protein